MSFRLSNTKNWMPTPMLSRMMVGPVPRQSSLTPSDTARTCGNSVLLAAAEAHSCKYWQVQLIQSRCSISALLTVAQAYTQGARLRQWVNTYVQVQQSWATYFNGSMQAGSMQKQVEETFLVATFVRVQEAKAKDHLRTLCRPLHKWCAQCRPCSVGQTELPRPASLCARRPAAVHRC